MVIRRTQDIGSAIRQRREAVGYTATEAAALAGVSRRLLIELERGKRANVGASNLLRILAMLGLQMTVRPRGLPGTHPTE